MQVTKTDLGLREVRAHCTSSDLCSELGCITHLFIKKHVISKGLLSEGKILYKRMGNGKRMAMLKTREWEARCTKEWPGSPLVINHKNTKTKHAKAKVSS